MSGEGSFSLMNARNKSSTKPSENKPHRTLPASQPSPSPVAPMPAKSHASQQRPSSSFKSSKSTKSSQRPSSSSSTTSTKAGVKIPVIPRPEGAVTMKKFQDVVNYDPKVHTTLKSQVRAVYNRWGLNTPVDSSGRPVDGKIYKFTKKSSVKIAAAIQNVSHSCCLTD